MEDSSKAAMVNYNDDSIRTMEGLKHIRLRPGMYIGALGDGTDPRDGIYTILKEVLDNSVDEFTTGFGKNIIVDVDEKTATVRDFGQGIPLGSVIKAVSTLNTSGRFDDSVYQKTIGLNGVGLKATNALSIDFYVASYRDGECSWAKFSRGELLDSGREASEEKNGVLIRFTPDEAMFPNYAYKMEHLEQMVRNYTCVKVGLTMTFNGRPYRTENGLPDWIAYNIPQMPLYEPVHLEGEDIELVLTHYDGSGTILGSFVNGQFTIDGGTHLSAFKEAVARALMDFYKKDYSADDCRQGLVGPQDGSKPRQVLVSDLDTLQQILEKPGKEPEIELCELWSLRHTLAKNISRYLKEFIEASSLSGSTPGGYYHMDPENCWNLWETDLWKMQKAFEDYAALDRPDECSEEKRKEIREGMQLFIDKYDALWY